MYHKKAYILSTMYFIVSFTIHQTGRNIKSSNTAIRDHNMRYFRPNVVFTASTERYALNFFR